MPGLLRIVILASFMAAWPPPACHSQTRLKITYAEDGTPYSATFSANSTATPLTLGNNTLRTIAGLRELKSLTLWGTTVTDADIEQLKGLQSLVAIDLSYTQVTGQCLQTLQAMPNLMVVILEGCDVSDEHVKQIDRIKRMSTLRLAKTKVTDEGLPYIGKLKQLVHLDLSSCDISDAGLASMGDLPILQHLWLSKTLRYGVDDKSNLTDKSIDYLASLDTLIDLQIADSRLTPIGLARLRTALPKTKIRVKSSGILYVDGK